MTTTISSDVSQFITKLFGMLYMAVVSDIHFGHRRNGTRDIARNFRAAFPDNAATAQLDIIWLAGDIFDDLFSLNDEDVLEVDLVIAYLLRICKKHDIVLRVLEGTPSHDWKQSHRFEHINEVTGIGADLKHVKDLSIEYIERFGITVLYVPDEWDNTETTLSQIHELLRAKGLDQVDYAIMHGQFEYQLPAHVKAPKHSSEAYLKLVKELIFIGHVHLHSRYDRIIAQGSFDRLSHGEEGPKGHVRAKVYANGNRDVVFVENEGAMKFVTVRCTDLSLEDTLNEVDDQVGDLPDGSQVRVEANHDHPIFTNMEVLIRRYPLFAWSKLPREDVTEEVALVEDATVFVPITINRDNLPALLLKRVADADVSQAVFDAAEALLKEVL